MINDVRFMLDDYGSQPCRYIAEIFLANGDVQRPTWRGLHRYWSYANLLEIEYKAKSFSGNNFVLCCSVASGQGGIVAIMEYFQ